MEQQDLTNLHDHAAVLRRRWVILLVFVLLGLATPIALSFLQTPLYTSETRLLLQNAAASPDDPATSIDPEEVATQAVVVVSDAVANRVRSALSLSEPTDDLIETVTVEGVEDQRILAVSATRPDAQEAADVANAFAQEYVAFQEDRAAEARNDVRDAYLTRLTDLKLEIADLNDRLAGAQGGRVVRLETEVQSLQARQAELQAALLASEDPATVQTTGGEVLQRAEPSEDPSSPRPIRAALLGLVSGLVLGLPVAYLRDRADDGIRDGDRLSSALGHAPVLGHIPTEAAEHAGRVTSLLDRRSPVSEAYRALNTNVRFLLAAHRSENGASQGADHGGMVMITSASPGEGKTSVATNLAVAAARVGMWVVLVDADLRSPAVSARFGLDIPHGLSDVLSGTEPVTDHLHDVGVANLRVLSAGSTPPNPAELLASPRAEMVWRELREDADLIVIDTPPILRVADPLELVGEVDDIIFVARQDQSRAHLVQAAVERIRRVGGRPSGAVLNDLGTVEKGDGYGYGYGPPPETPARRPDTRA